MTWHTSPPHSFCVKCPLPKCDSNGHHCGMVVVNGKVRRRVNAYGKRGNGPNKRDRREEQKARREDPEYRAKCREADKRWRERNPTANAEACKRYRELQKAKLGESKGE